MTVKEARKFVGWTQQRLSDELHIPKRTIEDWEGQRRKCPEWVESLILSELQRQQDREFYRQNRMREMILRDGNPHSDGIKTSLMFEELNDSEVLNRREEMTPADKQITAIVQLGGSVACQGTIIFAGEETLRVGNYEETRPAGKDNFFVIRLDNGLADYCIVWH